jgi:hypothetical protein
MKDNKLKTPTPWVGPSSPFESGICPNALPTPLTGIIQFRFTARPLWARDS